ncbi:MAG: SIS domain-containing protein [Armatimonadota bacterium]
MTHMLSEIHEQPAVLERLFDLEFESVQYLANTIRSNDIQGIIIAARGTSDNAATFGKYLLEIAAGIPVSLAAPSVFTLYHATLNLSKWLVIGVSQSGESTDVVEVLRQAEGMGALTAAITNVTDSPLARTAQLALNCHADKEMSVAATKTYTATLGVFYLLAAALTIRLEMVDDLRSALKSMREILALEEVIARSVERYRYMEECMVIARGINLATSQEAALKLSETCYVVAKPYSSADFLHGPIASVDEGFPVFIYAPVGPAYQTMLDVSQKVAKQGAELVVISSDDTILSYAKTRIRIPVHVDELYSPLVYIVAGQLFAHYLAIAKGYNPDQPRGLSKVTKTL